MMKNKRFFIFACIFVFNFFLFSQENFVIIESAVPHNLNPQTTSYSSDAQILTGLYEGLFSYNPITLEPQYAIAQSFRISRDKKRWTIKLRENAFFSNGDQITADSVRDSWLELLSNPDASYASLLDIVRGAKEFRTGTGSKENVGIVVQDKLTLAIYLNTPANYLPKVLCHHSFAIIHRNPTVYSGPYVLEEMMDGVTILKKNPNYWDKENTKMEQITFVQSNDAKENSYYYNTGAVDWIASDYMADKILNKDSIHFSTEFGTSYFFFKTSAKKQQKNDSIPKKVNPWDYPEFRNALLEAFPWEAIHKNFLVSATTFVFPLSGYPEVEGFSYTDLLEAQDIMKNARKKYGFSQEEILTLNIEVSEYAMAEETEKLISDALAPLGVEVKVNRLPTYTYLQSVPTSNADLFGYTWIGDFADPLAFLELFHGGSTLNDSGWQNAEFDSLLDEAAVVSDAERYTLLAKAEKILLDSGMVIPYYHPVSFNVIDLNSIGGWSVNAFDIHPLKYIFRQEVKKTIPGLVKYSVEE